MLEKIGIECFAKKEKVVFFVGVPRYQDGEATPVTCCRLCTVWLVRVYFE